MAGTKRTPISRPPRPVVTRRAVDLFKLGILKMQRDGVAQNSREFIEVALALSQRTRPQAVARDVFDIDIDTPVPEQLQNSIRDRSILPRARPASPAGGDDVNYSPSGGRDVTKFRCNYL